jgi:hypothetical protein
MTQPGEYDQASPLVQRLAYKQSSCADPDYLKLVNQQIIEAVVEADRARVEARCGFGRGHEGEVSFNRRLRMKNGMSWSHPGQGNPEIVDYAGPIDPEVNVIGVWDTRGRLLGCIVNFACHATTNPGGISANWIYYLEKTIQGALGMTAQVVFLQGACGDITQVDNLSRHQNPAGEKWAQLVGGRVGAEAVKVLLSMPSSSQVRLDARSSILHIPRRVPTPERARKATRLVQLTNADTNSADWLFAKETLLLDSLVQREPVAAVEVQAIQVGPAVFVSTPAEYFVAYGLELKRQSRFAFTIPVELANGCVGYVPTEEAFGPHGGGYETRLTSYSNLQPNAGRQMLEVGLELTRQMTPGSPPEFPPPPAFTQPWAYGNVPPELE